MDSETKWKALYLGVAVLSIIVPILLAIYTTEKEPDPKVEYNILNYVSSNNRVYYSEVLKATYHKKQNLISETKIIKPIPEDKVFYDNIIEFELQFIPKREVKSRLRAFLIDPRGIIQYEYPTNTIHNISDNKEPTDLNKRINLKLNLNNNNPSLIIDGIWHLNIILIDNDNDIIAEIIKPINIYSEERKSSNNVTSYFAIFIGLIIPFMIFSFRTFLQKNKEKEEQIKLKLIKEKEKQIKRNLGFAYPHSKLRSITAMRNINNRQKQGKIAVFGVLNPDGNKTKINKRKRRTDETKIK